jgi:hypothetical protein
VPDWVRAAVDCWTAAAQVTDGRIFGCVNKTGAVWGGGITEKVIRCVVKEFASKAQIGNLAPHDLRRTCARLCHVAGGQPEQIRFLPGHESVQTTEKVPGLQAEAAGRRERSHRHRTGSLRPAGRFSLRIPDFPSRMAGCT